MKPIPNLGAEGMAAGAEIAPVAPQLAALSNSIPGHGAMEVATQQVGMVNPAITSAIGQTAYAIGVLGIMGLGIATMFGKGPIAKRIK